VSALISSTRALRTGEPVVAGQGAVDGAARADHDRREHGVGHHLERGGIPGQGLVVPPLPGERVVLVADVQSEVVSASQPGLEPPVGARQEPWGVGIGVDAGVPHDLHVGAEDRLPLLIDHLPA
jgi:hypothetical protein